MADLESIAVHIIAAVYFNINLHRDNRKNEDGSEQMKVVSPKFKNGEATVQNVKVKPNYDYVEEMFKKIKGSKKRVGDNGTCSHEHYARKAATKGSNRGMEKEKINGCTRGPKDFA
ncbi:Hypothetical predicted protein, partial [Paramuricea clavata]